MSNFILRMLRPEQREAWERFCQETGAEFTREKVSPLRKADTLSSRYKHWIIKIDSFKKGKKPTLTRVRAAYLNADSFYFRIYREGLFQGLQKKLGLEDILVGYPEFDDAFIIQGNDERKLKQLFSKESIRKIITWQPDIHLKNEVDEHWKIHEEGQGISLLEFKVMGLITDVERLIDLHTLFSELLDQMVEIGSAHPDSPFSTA